MSDYGHDEAMRDLDHIREFGVPAPMSCQSLGEFRVHIDRLCAYIERLTAPTADGRFHEGDVVHVESAFTKDTGDYTVIGYDPTGMLCIWMPDYSVPVQRIDPYRAIIASAAPTAESATCPTCGSDDPKVRGHRHGTNHTVWHISHAPEAPMLLCPDSFHDAPTPADTEED